MQLHAHLPEQNNVIYILELLVKKGKGEFFFQRAWL